MVEGDQTGTSRGNKMSEARRNKLEALQKREQPKDALNQKLIEQYNFYFY